MLQMIVGKIRSNQPDIVVLEDTVLQRNPKTLKELAKLQGSILGVCFYMDIPCSIIGCPTWRKCLGFKQGSKVKRPELKQQAHDYVMEHFNIDASEDECDAICIGCAYQLMNETSV